MKVVTAHTMQELDRRAINEYGVPGRELMENAGRACAAQIVAACADCRDKQAVILAGKGNNGGDGYVIARHLLDQGWQVGVIVLARRREITGDALTNLVLLPDAVLSFCPTEGELATKYRDELQRATVVVDALLGTGLKDDLRGLYREAVALINDTPGMVVAVDIPTGVHGTTGRILGEAVQADLTVSFGLAKLGQVLYPGAQQTGRLVVVDIGIPAPLLSDTDGYDYLDEACVAPLVIPRAPEAHKGTFGHCLVIAGAVGASGAAALAANSAVRAGAGLVTLACPATINPILEVKTTEAMTAPLPDAGAGYLTETALSLLERLLATRNTVALGPGIGRHQETVALVQRLVTTVSQPLVIDADALNALAEDLSVLQRRRSAVIVLTPHPGEMARLLGTPLPDMAAVRISVAQEFARKHALYLVLKGAHTIIAAPDGQVAINGSGNPGMASGGMGDLLTGVITALLAQGYHPWQACRLGVFAHGLAGDLAAAELGEIGLCAGDLLKTLPLAFNRLLHRADAPRRTLRTIHQPYRNEVSP